jgi:hypothetical protein
VVIRPLGPTASGRLPELKIRAEKGLALVLRKGPDAAFLTTMEDICATSGKAKVFVDSVISMRAPADGTAAGAGQSNQMCLAGQYS